MYSYARSKFIIWVPVLIFLLAACHSFTPEQKAELDQGYETYLTYCISCHGGKGDGMQGAYPSLLNKTASKSVTDRTIYLIKNGSGHESGMKPIPLSAEEIAAVVNYIQNSWGNRAPFITENDI